MNIVIIIIKNISIPGFRQLMGCQRLIQLSLGSLVGGTRPERPRKW
jgi:hypothetical protein